MNFHVCPLREQPWLPCSYAQLPSQVVVSAIAMPLDLAFDLERGRRRQAIVALFVLLDASFVIDFLLSFRFAYADEGSNMLIRQPIRIFRRWLAGWFVFDFVAALPLNLVNLVDHPAQSQWLTVCLSDLPPRLALFLNLFARKTFARKGRNTLFSDLP